MTNQVSVKVSISSISTVLVPVGTGQGLTGMSNFTMLGGYIPSFILIILDFLVWLFVSPELNGLGLGRHVVSFLSTHTARVFSNVSHLCQLAMLSRSILNQF